MKTFLLKSGFLTIVFLIANLFFASAAFGQLQATVTTDKDDYAPGEYVIITGTGWTPGETVTLHFDETPKPATCLLSHDRTVVADAVGNIYYDLFLIKENHLGVAFVLTATGQTSGLQAFTNFTDAAEQVKPRAGTILGATAATIAGSSFSTGVYTITFGNATPVSATRASNNTLNNITIPAHPVGTVTVQVNGPNSASSSTLANGFTYVCRTPSNIIFDESMGNVQNNTAISLRESGDGFDNDTYTMSGTGDIRDSSNSSPSNDYPWASGNANVFLQKGVSGIGSSFQIEGINSSGLSNVELSFAIFKSVTASNGSELKVEYSIDGSNYSPLSFASLPTGSGTTGWYYRMVTESLPATSNLRIRFRNTAPSGGSNPDFRIDDIRLISSPPITSQPTSDTKCVGEPVTFSVAATGTGLVYQWRKDAAIISGANGASYTIASVSAADAGNYDVIVNGGCSSSTSDAVTLTVKTAPSILTQPTNQTVTYGVASTSFSVIASGSPAPTYKWQVNTGLGFTDIPGETSSSLSVANPTVSMSGNLYHVIITNTCSTVTSNNVSLTVNAMPITVTADAGQTKVYGAADPASYTYASLPTGLLSNGAT
ncbi:IPT/TIG domain-containing protein, partial [Flavobacterium sp. ZB4P13]|uniref:IPT/TIG domain-containing protein n=1 Tax=Flavobacterium sp. ZB4P13 TaxID=3401728 RepID=UPI003AACF0CC